MSLLAARNFYLEKNIPNRLRKTVNMFVCNDNKARAVLHNDILFFIIHWSLKRKQPSKMYSESSCEQINTDLSVH